eukprot:TRINITY_DN25874_c1_g1_i1.p1 TRINITY_DN25874_c1_g1~~TRINITY_DN25874_c1_g1_i1.p1  ORF type:complete len:847 (-),score=166.16 TRINITY_DN25874_c1_g1_i1:157-2697(-)
MGQSHGIFAEDDSGSSSDDDDVDKLASATKTGILRQGILCADTEEENSQAPLVLIEGTKGAAVRPVSTVPDLAASWTSQAAPGTVRLKPEDALLHVYDLQDGAIKQANHVLTFFVDQISVGGAFHAAVEVYGSEWTYGMAGVDCAVPRAAEGHVYRCSIYLGRTELSQLEVAEVLHGFCRSWRGGEYDLLEHNCCSFAAEFSERLGVGPMPAWVDRLARLLSQGKAAGRVAGQACREGAALAGKEVASWAGAAGSLLLQGGCGMVAQNKCAEADVDRADLASDMDFEMEQYGKDGDDVVLKLPNAQRGIVVRGNQVTMVSLRQGRRRSSPKNAELVYSAWHRTQQLSQIPEAMPALSAGPANSVDAFAMPATVFHLNGLDAGDGSWTDDALPTLMHLQEQKGQADELSPEGLGELPAADSSALCGSESGPGKLLSASLELPSGEPVAAFSSRNSLPIPITSLVDLPASIDDGEENAEAGEVDDGAGDFAIPRTTICKKGDEVDPASPCVVYAPKALPERSPMTHALEAEFPEGSEIEYLSASYGRWIAAKVVKFNKATGLYDLDCRGAAQKSSIRWPLAKKTGAYARISSPLAEVSNLPNNQKTADASKKKSVEMLDLSGQAVQTIIVGPGDAAIRIDTVPGMHNSRRGSGPNQAFPIGSVVEYASETQKQWLPTNVVAYHAASGLYDLVCKAQVLEAKIRWPQDGGSFQCPGKQDACDSAAQKASRTDGSPSQPSTRSAISINSRPQAFPLGASVEYNSNSQGWVSARVLSWHPAAGTYDLSCKAQVPFDKIRAPFKAGDIVEYESATSGWISAKVISFACATGLYGLDCKAQVPPAKLRNGKAK